MALTTLTAQLENRSDQVRGDVITHGVALLPGELGPADLAVELKAVGATATDERVQWRPVGRRWGPEQSGSYRYIEVSYRADLTANQEKQVTISQATSGSLVPFALHANVTSGISTGSVSFQVNGTTRTIPLSTIVQPANLLTTASTNDCKRRYRFRGRLEAVATTQLNGVGFEVTLDLYSGLEYANIYIKYYYGRVDTGFVNTSGGLAPGSGNPWNNHTLTVTTAATFSSTIACYMMWETKRFHAVDHNGGAGPHIFTLHDPAAATGTNRNQWNIGRPYRRKGRLFFGSIPGGTNKEMDSRGAAMDLPTKRCAPYFYVPDYPAYVTSRDNAITRLKAFRTTEEAESANTEPLGTAGFYAQNNSPLGGEAGMFGFGSQHAILMLRAGHPAILEVMEREAYQDSLRGGEYFDADGNPWDHTLFPTVQIWQGKLFYPTGSSTYFPDSMGINNYGAFNENTNVAIPALGGSWRGQDREHWCLVGQMQAALMGCDYHMLDQFETYHSQQVVTSNYIDKYLFTGNIPDPTSGRDWGRGSMLAGVCAYEVSGSAELLEKCVRDRVRLITEVTYGRDGRYYGAPGGSTRGTPPLAEQTFPTTASGFGGWDQQSGGRSGFVMPTPASANHNDKALPDHQGDPIWVCGPAAVGAWAAYLLLQDTDGDTELTNTTLRVAADLSGDVVREGFLVVNAGDSNRYRFINLNRAATLPAPSSLDAANYATFLGQVMTGSTSGASGVIVHIGYDDGDDNGAMRCHLKGCNNALFSTGETVTIGATGITSTVRGTKGPVMGASVVWKKDDASFLTTSELEEQYVSTSGSFYVVPTLVYRNINYYNPYGPLLAGAAAIAQHLARNGYYTSVHGNANAEILARATLVLDIMKASADSYAGTTWDGNPSPGYYEYASVAPPQSGSQVPGVPGNLRNTNITQTSFTANWDPGSGFVDLFNVRYREIGEIAWVPAGSVPGGTFFLAIEGLVAETDYEWSVNAENGVGESEYAASLDVTTLAAPGAAPAAPTGQDTANITETSFTFLFVQADSLVERFETRYRVVGAPAWTEGPEVLPQFTGAQIEQPLTGLVADTDYEAQARARNGNGFSAFTASALAHTLAAAGAPPGAPTIGTPTNITSAGFQVNWVPADLTEDEFIVNYRVSGVGGYTPVTVPARTYQYSISGLDPETEYEVYVVARNGNGYATSDTIEVTTLEALVAPTAPNNLSVVNINPYSALLRWSLTSTNQTEVFLRYGPTAGAWIDVDPLPPNATEYAVNGLEPDTEYQFQVAARNSAGDSDWSDAYTWETTQVTRLPLNPSILGDILDDF